LLATLSPQPRSSCLALARLLLLKPNYGHVRFPATA
jgi:hypothetical protein